MCPPCRVRGRAVRGNIQQSQEVAEHAGHHSITALLQEHPTAVKWTRVCERINTAFTPGLDPPAPLKTLGADAVIHFFLMYQQYIQKGGYLLIATLVDPALIPTICSAADSLQFKTFLGHRLQPDSFYEVPNCKLVPIILCVVL